MKDHKTVLTNLYGEPEIIKIGDCQFEVWTESDGEIAEAAMMYLCPAIHHKADMAYWQSSNEAKREVARQAVMRIRNWADYVLKQIETGEIKGEE